MLMDGLPASHPAVEESLGEALDLGSPEKVEVAAAVRLLDVLIVEPAIAARVPTLRGAPSLASTLELIRVDAETQPAGGNVELDDVPVAHEGERAADCGLRRNVQQGGAIGRAAHSRIRDADHVANTALEEFARQGEHAPLRHRRAHGTGVAQNEHTIL